jgi:hypothetical protein
VQPAKAATSSIPIVFLVHADPEGTGHVASLARPGGNITGLANLQTDLAPKELELLISAVPVAKRIAVLWNPDTPSHIPGLKAVEEAGRTLRVQLQAVGARNRSRASGRLLGHGPRAQAVLVIGSPVFIAERQRVAQLAITHRLLAAADPDGLSKPHQLDGRLVQAGEVKKVSVGLVRRDPPFEHHPGRARSITSFTGQDVAEATRLDGARRARLGTPSPTPAKLAVVAEGKGRSAWDK